MKLTPVGTRTGNWRSSGRASSADSSTIRTGFDLLPCRQRRRRRRRAAFFTQSAFGKPATT